MDQISLEKVKKWNVYGGFYLPKSINHYCPYCDEKVVFIMETPNQDTKRDFSHIFSGECPACEKQVFFYIIRPKQHKPDGDCNPESIYMYPPVTHIRAPKDFSPFVNGPLQSSYESTLDSYNSKNFIATAVGCRRTLEGLFHYLLPEDKREKNLMRAIEKAKIEIDWSSPLNNLAHMIRQGGNIGAHFNEHKEPTEDVAKAMIDLLEYLFEYLYELPNNIQNLDSSIRNA